MKKLSLVFSVVALCTALNSDGGAVSRILPSAATSNNDDFMENRANVAVTSTSRTAVKSVTPGVSRINRILQKGETDGTVARVVSRGGTYLRPQSGTGVDTRGRSARNAASGMNDNPTVRRAGITLRPTTAEFGGRAVIAGTDKQTGSNIGSEVRSVQSRAAVQSTRETFAEAKERMQQVNELNKSCQEQYNECMDQFCAVVDANQKRCSCSANLSRYAKVESAVKDANTQLNEVAQRIRYVGLSADEISAIMTATEAEDALSTTKDNSETRSMLDDIAKLIKDPTTPANSYSSTTSFGLDMDLDFTDDASDIFSLDFLGANSGSFANLRGKNLYNAAAKRCKTILNQCKDAGATPDQITGNYDLAIDKDCIAYEQGLTKMNETLVSNVRSANRMLQKARLAVLENKNQYDAKGCIAALETCMTDDMVCGSDYAKCLDPTKRYIDENGNVIFGQDISKITELMQDYDNSQIDGSALSEAYALSSISCDAQDGKCLMKYLLQKIGVGNKVGDSDYGLCRPVLDKCQNYTYDTRGKYKPYNDVVINYIQRAMVNIRAAQHRIISKYASECMTDVATCYNNQVTQVNSWASSADVTSVRNVMAGACRNVALTCAYAVFADDDTHCSNNDTDTCITSISEMFYQSLLCPDNSTWDAGFNTVSDHVQNRARAGWVNTQCKCNDGYYVFGGSCLSECAAGQYVNSYGSCTTCPVGEVPTSDNDDMMPDGCEEPGP